MRYNRFAVARYSASLLGAGQQEGSQEIKALDVNGKVSAIERQIDALDADRRGRQLEERRNGEIRQVEQAIDGFR